MKKLIVLLTVVCLTQITFSQTRWGLRGGLNIVNQKKTLGYGQNVVIKGEAIPSFHIGMTSDIRITHWLFMQPSLLLNGKGANFKVLAADNSGTYTRTDKVRPYYLELPMLFVAKKRLPDPGINIFAGAGPSLGYGIFGKAKSESGSNTAFYNDQDGLKRFDFGIDVTAGVELPSGWQFSCHFIPGIANISADNGPEPWETKNKVFALSIGYFFTRK